MSNNESQQLIEQVTLELQEMKKLGMRVPFDPSKFTDAQKAEIVEYRDYLHQLVIRSLLKSHNTEALWQFTLYHEPEYDVLALLEQLLPASDGRRAAVSAKLTQLGF